MTLLQIVDNIERIALTQPNIRSVGEGNIYSFMNNNPSVKYGVFFILQNNHTEYQEYTNYNFTLFFIDRLEDDLESNRIRIQSNGMQVISNIVSMLCEKFDIDFPNMQYTSFTQKFLDMCAGVYATISFNIYKDTICADEE